ncbi:MAG TPA: DUF4382 domain-containing protein [Longimicrobiaceae bacterium]|nr:DUF4382 domain-containing protein [Longimicrobiaceae bacterium]
MVARNRTILLPALAGALLLGACEASTGSLAPNGSARLTVQLTDAPGDLKEARVKLSKVVLQGREGGDTAAARQELTVSGGEWIDLLTLSGGKLKDLVSGATVPPGTYSQLRLVVDGAYVVTRDGRVFATKDAQLPSSVTADGELVCPSCSQSGFKVKFPGGITVEDATTLVIDFDVNQSFGHEAGKSGKFVLKPVLIGARKGGGTPALGTIGGTVTLAQGVAIPACGGQATLDLTRFVPTATGGTTTKTGTTQANGAYVIGAVASGSYTLGVDRVGFANGDTLSFTATATPATVAVAAGTKAAADYTVTAATCKAAG